MSPAEKQLPKPQRRWFQLRLRTLLVLVTLVSMLLGWISWEQEQRRQEQTTIAWVEEMGGTVSFESEINSGLETSGWKKTKDAWFGKRVAEVNLTLSDQMIFERWFPEELSEVGIFLSTLHSLRFPDASRGSRPRGSRPRGDSEQRQAFIKAIQQRAAQQSGITRGGNSRGGGPSVTAPNRTLRVNAKKLKDKDREKTKVSDLSPLAVLQNLEALSLIETEVHDLSPLADLKKLKYLDLNETKVTKERIDELKLALPTCLILTDLATDPQPIHIKGLTTPRYPIMPTVPPDYFHK